MNIDRLNQNRAAGAYGTRTGRSGEAGGAGRSDAADAASQGGEARTDGVAVSEQARQAQRAEAAVRAAPDVREEVVAELREQVQGGTYQTQDEQVARRLLGASD